MNIGSFVAILDCSVLYIEALLISIGLFFMLLNEFTILVVGLIDVGTPLVLSNQSCVWSSKDLLLQHIADNCNGVPIHLVYVPAGSNAF